MGICPSNPVPPEQVNKGNTNGKPTKNPNPKPNPKPTQKQPTPGIKTEQKDVVPLPRTLLPNGSLSMILPPFKGFSKINKIEDSYIFLRNLYEDSFERIDKYHHINLQNSAEWKVRTIKKSTVYEIDEQKRNNLIN